MSLGGTIERESDGKRAAGLRGWMLLPLIITGISALLGSAALIVAPFTAMGNYLPVFVLAADVVLAWACLYFGIQQRKPARPLIVIYFSMKILIEVAMVLLSPTLAIPLPAIIRWFVYGAIVVFVGFSERAKHTFNG